MPANVETMFYTREKPWHGLGIMAQEAPTSKDALVLAGLDWNVVQKEIRTQDGEPITGFLANIRETDNKILGVVTERYKIVQNRDAFAFTDALLGEGVTYETAGSLQEGKRTWMLARLPQEYIINEDKITPYLVFMNSHDGTGAIRAAMTPVRVVCQNTLNLALSTAKRSWSTNHTGDITGKMEDAKYTLLHAEHYMGELVKTFEQLRQVKISDRKVYDYINVLFPLLDSPTDLQRRNLMKLKEDLKMRYFDAPDLKRTGKNALRFVNAVSDFATHTPPLRMTRNYKENLFARTIDGNAVLDRAYQLVNVL